MKNLHRITGIIVAVFVCIHLFNHAMAGFGIQAHQEWMQLFRKFYYLPIVEILLIGAFGFQAITGIQLFLKLRKKENKSRLDRLKIYSGLILGLFLVQHIGATLGQRFLLDLDTNFYFAAVVVNQSPLLYYFVPYYFIGIMAFGLHLASIHHSKISKTMSPRTAKLHFVSILCFFFVLAIFILFVFMGGLYPIVIPQEYHLF